MGEERERGRGRESGGVVQVREKSQGEAVENKKSTNGTSGAEEEEEEYS